VTARRWLGACLALLAVALAVFMIPSRLEGEVLLAITPGHGLTTMDLVALAPLVAASVLLLGGLWRRRGHLAAALAGRPAFAAGAPFAAGLGLGLLLASVYGFFWWWVIGAGLLTAVLVALAVVAAGGDRG
jgi:hypothetical protein